MVIFITGLSGAGKTTIARALNERLLALLGSNPHEHVRMIDGDVVRERFGGDLGFSREDREEQIRRIGRLAVETIEEGSLAICSAIAPYESSRSEMRRMLTEKGTRYLEVYVSTPLSVCAERDPKGLYRKAYAGEIEKMTGVDDPYEPPSLPDVEIDTSERSVEDCVEEIVKKIQSV